VQNYEPLVSVTIPTYNSGKYLEETIASILRQSYDNIEIIIVDDGSTDNTSDIIKKFDTHKIKYMYQENSGSPSNPRNVALRNALGDLICLFDSDDVMAANKLEYSVNIFNKEPNVDFVFSDFNVTNENGEIINAHFLDDYRSFRKLLTPIRGCDNCYLLSGDVYLELLIANFIGTPSVLFKRQLFSHIGYFDESLRSAEDIDYWYRVALAGKTIAYLDAIGFSYRRRKDSITSHPNENIQYILRVFEKQLINAHTDEQLKQVNKQIYRVLLTDAWAAFKSNKYESAILKYTKLLTHRITFYGIKGYLLSHVMQRFAKIRFKTTC
jgi:glycosyltransferase involved in cell wall biosynthesis